MALFFLLSRLRDVKKPIMIEDSIDAAKFQGMKLQIAEYKARACKNNLCLVQLSKRRFAFVAMYANGADYWQGGIVFGPASSRDCLAWFKTKYIDKTI